MTTQHRFFKGGTRPATLAGVPLVPMILGTGLCAIVFLWVALLVSWYVALVIAFIWSAMFTLARLVSRNDEHRLNQVLLKAKVRRRQGNKKLWGNASYSPIRYERRV